MKKLLLILVLAVMWSSAVRAGAMMGDIDYGEGTEPLSEWAKVVPRLLAFFVLSWVCIKSIKVQIENGFDWGLCVVFVICGSLIVQTIT
jgi:hypothetical protein